MDSFDFDVNSNLSPRYIELLNEIMNIIDDLELKDDLPSSNAKILMNFARKLNNQLLTHIERSKLASDFQKAVDQVLSFSDVPDQIISKCDFLKKKFPEEFHNISYDFRNLRSFKYPVLEDCKNALINLKNHGQRDEAAPILNLVELRILHFNLFTKAEGIQASISEMMVKESRRNDPNNLTKERFDDILKELQETKQEALKFSDKWKKAKSKYKTMKELNERLNANISLMRDDFEYRQKVNLLEIERRDKELRQLRNVAHDHSQKHHEIQSLKSQNQVLHAQIQSLQSQIQGEKERYESLEAKYRILFNENERLAAQLKKQ